MESQAGLLSEAVYKKCYSDIPAAAEILGRRGLSDLYVKAYTEFFMNNSPAIILNVVK